MKLQRVPLAVRVPSVLLVLLFGVAAQAAEPMEPPPTGAAPAPSEAANMVARARQLFQDRQYEDAAAAMQQAYGLDPKPLYLFNAGQSYRKAEKRKEALEMYRRYLGVVADGTLAVEARSYATDLEALLRAQERLQDVQLQIESREVEARKTQAELEAEKQKALQMEQALKKERERPIYKRPWFIATAAVVGTVIVVGGIVLISYAAQDSRAQAKISLSF